jgi:hypothetical protein
MKLTISNSTNKNKRLKAVFIDDNNKTITRHFGFKGGSQDTLVIRVVQLI